MRRAFTGLDRRPAQVQIQFQVQFAAADAWALRALPAPVAPRAPFQVQFQIHVDRRRRHRRGTRAGRSGRAGSLDDLRDRSVVARTEDPDRDVDVARAAAGRRGCRDLDRGRCGSLGLGRGLRLDYREAGSSRVQAGTSGSSTRRRLGQPSGPPGPCRQLGPRHGAVLCRDLRHRRVLRAGASAPARQGSSGAPCTSGPRARRAGRRLPATSRRGLLRRDERAPAPRAPPAPPAPSAHRFTGHDGRHGVRRGGAPRPRRRASRVMRARVGPLGSRRGLRRRPPRAPGFGRRPTF